MKTEMDPTKIVDLSFLSEDEQLALQKVLKRDAALQKLEETRIWKLKRTNFDASKWKVMTGEWFAEVKSKRYGDISSGIDILKNAFNKNKKIPVVQDVAVKASKDATVFLSPSPQYQDISPEPETFESEKRFLEEAESVPQENAAMSQSHLQAIADRHAPKDEAVTWEEDDIKAYMKGHHQDHENESTSSSNEVLLTNIDSSITAVDEPVSETNPYSDFPISQPTHSAKQEFSTPKEDLILHSPRRKPTDPDIQADRSVQPSSSPEETEESRRPDVSEQIGYFKHSPPAEFESHVSGLPHDDAEIIQEPTKNHDWMKGPSLSSGEIPFNSEENYSMHSADTRQKNPFSRNSSTLLSEILQGGKKLQKDGTDYAIKSNITAEQNAVNESVVSESPDTDSLFSSRPSYLKSIAANTKPNESKGKGQQRDNIWEQSSEPDKNIGFMNDVSSQTKKPGEYYSDTPNPTFGRGETEPSKRKGILKRSPSTSSTESESLSKRTSIRSTEDIGAMPLQAEDSDGTTKMDAGSKQVRFSTKMRNKRLANIFEGWKTDEAHNSSLIMSDENTMPQQQESNVNIFSSLSPAPAQRYETEPDVNQYLTDKGTTEQDHFPSLKWGENSEAQQKNYQVHSNDSSDFSVKTNKPSSLLTASEATLPNLPLNDPQNEEYDYFDDLTSESSFGSDILKQTDVHVSSNLQSSKLSGSLLSLYSDAGDFGDLPIQGAVQFKLHYEDAKKEFQIHVLQCRGLAVANKRKYTSDPYVKTYLLPDRSRPSKRKSSVKKATLNPQYNEILKYKIKKQELQSRTLNLSVWHNDTLGRNVFLGETEVEMNNWDWSNNTLNWCNLQPKLSSLPEGNINQGDICVALKYIPAESIGNIPPNGEVHIWLKGATKLQPLKPGGVDSFVRCYILPDTSKKSRQKTRVVKKTLNPIYNHTMVYDGFRLDEIIEACAELSIWDHETFTNQFLGGIRLNLGTGTSYGQNVDWMDSNEEEAALWKEMMSKPNHWVEAVLPLRPTMTKRK
ncbi:synaptotagmin-like protein 2 isoform X2 [Heterodontus francisci]|uniref:synaptotagmin-like protein 2 isoform X2 n=1 Tax=Heterodontus francisci TaxID=7792 RepID=UPI00355B4058